MWAPLAHTQFPAAQHTSHYYTLSSHYATLVASPSALPAARRRLLRRVAGFALATGASSLLAVRAWRLRDRDFAGAGASAAAFLRRVDRPRVREAPPAVGMRLRPARWAAPSLAASSPSASSPSASSATDAADGVERPDRVLGGAVDAASAAAAAAASVSTVSTTSSSPTAGAASAVAASPSIAASTMAASKRVTGEGASSPTAPTSAVRCTGVPGGPAICDSLDAR